MAALSNLVRDIGSSRPGPIDWTGIRLASGRAPIERTLPTSWSASSIDGSKAMNRRSEIAHKNGQGAGWRALAVS